MNNAQLASSDAPKASKPSSSEKIDPLTARRRRQRTLALSIAHEAEEGCFIRSSN